MLHFVCAHCHFAFRNACKDTVRDLACNCGAVLLALMRRSGYEKVAKRTVDRMMRDAVTDLMVFIGDQKNRQDAESLFSSG